MTFVAAPHTSPQVPVVAADQIGGDGWWPAASIGDFRAAMRVGEMVNAVRVRDALVAAMVTVADALAKWRAAQSADTLETVAAASFGGDSRPVILWRRAVYATAAADLAETHNDITAGERGRAERDERAAAADELRRTATQAIRDLLGRSRAKVVLV